MDFVSRKMESYTNKYDLEYLKRKIFSTISLIMRILAGPVMFYGAYLFYQEGQKVLAAIEATLPILILTVLSTEILNLYRKRFFVVVVFYLLGNMLVIFAGPSGAGMVVIVFSFLLVILFLNKKHRTVFFFIHLAITAIMTVLLYLGYLNQFDIVYYGEAWFINVICVLIGITAMYYVWGIIYNGLTSQIERFELAIRGSNDGIWDWDINSNEIYFSPRLKQQLGYEEKELLDSTETYLELLFPDGKELFLTELNRFIESGQQQFDIELRLKHKNDNYRWIRIRGEAFRDENGKAHRMAGSHTDITARKIAEKALEESEEKYRMITENTADVIWVLNADRMEFSYISPSVQQLMGYTVEEVRERTIRETMPRIFADRLAEQLADAIKCLREDPESVPVLYNQIQQYCKNGQLIWSEFSAKCRYNKCKEVEIVGVSRDISERIQREEKIKYIATHDQLTDLLNLSAFRLMLLDTDSEKNLVGNQSVISIDIDHFRVVNDSLSHLAGDQMIAKIANIIKTEVDDKGTVYRIEGDEFIIVITDLEPERIHLIARAVHKSVASQVIIHERFFSLTASIGYCIGEGESLEQILKNANTALYVAKKRKNCIVAYDSSMDKLKTRETLLEEDLNSALENNEFVIHFQPIVDAKTEQILHSEALIRWVHPVFGMVSPAEFIPIAEKTKIITPITYWVIEECCRKLKDWETKGILNMKVSINLSLVLFENQGDEILDYMISKVKASGIEPERIKLEITESSLMNNPEEIISIFRALKENGFKMALDDFGTGYSSFGYLKDLPLDIIKLDRSLISMVEHDKREQLIVRTMITIAHGLKLNVVAEGVETTEQFEFLKQNGCDLIQGYLFSKPLPEDDFIQYYFSKK